MSFQDLLSVFMLRILASCSAVNFVEGVGDLAGAGAGESFSSFAGAVGVGFIAGICRRG